MPANKYALLRYRIIDNCLTNRYKPYPTKEELRQACEDHLYGSQGEFISESTIEKDLWAMRNETELGYNAPIAYHAGHRGYYYTDPEYTIKDIALRDEEVNAIRYAAQILYQFRGVEPFNQFEKAIEKIMNKVAVPNLGDKPDNTAIQFEAAPGDVGAEHLGILLEAIQRKLRVRIRYQKFTEDNSQTYSLDPLLLKEYRNRWYLIAYRTESSKIQSFGLERIRFVELTEEEFTPPLEFDPEDYFSRSVGITAFEAKPVKVRFRVDAVTARYIETQPVHQSQYKIDHSKGGGTFELEVLITEELLMYFLSLGSRVEILAPTTLRDEMTRRIGEALDLYTQ